MMKKLYLITVTLLAAAAVFAGRDKNLVQIKGSDTMVNLGQAWAEKYMEQNTTDFISVTGGGSGTGLSSLISGTCDIAMSSRNIKNKEIELAKKKGINPYEIKVALDGLAVVVHPKNPVSKLTLDQLADIFTGKITNWKQLGGSDSQIVILSREVNSGTHVYFKEHVLRRNDPASTAEFAPSALMLSSSQAIADEVAGNPAAIGFYGMGYISNKQKALSIAKDPNSEFEVPTIENVISGKYPISRPLLLYTNGEPQGLVKKFVDYALSKEGQDIVVKTDFVPITKPPHQNAMSLEPNVVTEYIPASKKLWTKHIQFWCGGK
ncbi:MAG: phosphate ABC transporter substrate-binding protein [Phycisphaerae bacterium]|nr:phosphate ABC transporter substrate-binding protein [Phycisphaerae bacterium]